MLYMDNPTVYLYSINYSIKKVNMIRFKRPNQQSIQDLIKPVKCEWPTVKINNVKCEVDEEQLFVILAIVGSVVAAISGFVNGAVNSFEARPPLPYVLLAISVPVLVAVSVGIRWLQLWLSGAPIKYDLFYASRLSPHPAQLLVQLFNAAILLFMFVAGSALGDLLSSYAVICFWVIGIVATVTSTAFAIRWRNQQRLLIMANLSK